MEKKLSNEIKISEKRSNAHVYIENGCTFIVHRDFDENGGVVLEQVVSLLLDMMDKKKAKYNKENK